MRLSDWAQYAVVGAFMLLGAAVFAGATAFFMRSFRILMEDPYAGEVIVRYVLEASFLFVFFLGVASFITSSISALYRSPEIDLLSAFPVKSEDLFFYRFAGPATLSLWPILLVALPALLSLGIVSGAGVAFFFFGLLVLLLLVASVVLVGAVLSFVAGAVVRHIPPRLTMPTGIAVFLGAAVGVARVAVPKGIFGPFFDVSTPQAVIGRTAELREIFGNMPSHPFVELLSAAMPGFAHPVGVAGPLLAVAIMAVVSAVLLHTLVVLFYLPLVRLYRETGFLAQPEDVIVPARRHRFPSYFRWKHSFLFEKDLILLFRSPRDVSRAGSLILLLVFYLFAVRGVAEIEAFRRLDLFSVLVATAFFSIGYFAVTLGIRFAFPFLSTEGRSAWIFWTSPIHIHEFFSWKFFFWSALVSVFTVAASVFTIIIFALPVAVGLFFVFAMLCATVGIIAVTLGQGSIYPNFHERDPDMLSTSPAGLAATAMCFIFLWVVARYVREFTYTYLASGMVDLIPAFGVLIVSFTLIGLYWILAPRAMDKMEISC